MSSRQPWPRRAWIPVKARRPIVDLKSYELHLKQRMDPTASILQGIHARARQAQARMIFAEGDDPRVLRAAVAYQRSGLGRAMVVGREQDVREKLEATGLGDAVRELGGECWQQSSSRPIQGFSVPAAATSGL